jgi:DNA polymerase-3 subunit alpha
VDFAMLEGRSEGVIALVGGVEGVVSYYLYDKRTSDGSVMDRKAPFKAAALLRRLKTIFDDDHVFLDVQSTGQYYEEEMNQGMRDLAKQYGLTTVATTNVHYASPSDAEAHRTLFSMTSEYGRSTPVDFTTEQFFIASRDAMESKGLLQEELDATLAIADRCNVEIDLDKRRLPKYKFIPEGRTAMEHLVELCRVGYLERGLGGKESPTDESYAHRMNRELADIDEMGFADYFLIVHDVVSWCESQDMLLGYGRGSAGGSLVSYVLGITKMDPMEYGLIWERFLNKGRGGLPDIDTDVPQSRRQEVLAYIRERFGAGNVAQIVTYGGMKARSVLKEVFRVYGVDFDTANAITALVPAKNNDHAQPTLDEALEMVPALREYEKKYKAWFTIARALEGCYKSIGIHAAGVVISDVPFEESSYPLCRSASGDTQLFAWDMNTVDTLSLLKLDILGLTNLDDIQIARDIVERRGGDRISRETMPLDDQETFGILARGLNIGVFQVEKSLGKNWSKLLQPGSIDEISDLVSLIRPGPLDSGMATQYKEVKNGEADPSYIHEKLEPILGPTKSACLYQEQVIYICQQLAGMNSVDADMVRKAMGKKKPEEMAKWREVFLKGCADFSQMEEETSDEIWSFIVTFAGYGFNKSHGVGYGLLTYETAFMKAHHPTEFLCAKMRHAADAEEIKLLVYDAKLFDIDVVPPRVSAGNEKFDVVADTQISFGLTGLRGVGAAAIKSVVGLTEIAGDPCPEAFEALLWALFSDTHKVNSGVVKALILSGAFDDFGVQRVRAIAQYNLLAGMTPKQRDKLWNLYTEQQSGYDWIRVLRGAVDEDKFEAIKERFGVLLANVAQRKKIRALLATYDAADPLDRLSDKIRWEKQYLGLGLSGSLADGFRVRNQCRDIIRDGYDGMPVEIAVEIDDFREILTRKKRQPMAFVTASDSTYQLDSIVVFPNLFERYGNLIEAGSILKIIGKLDERGSLLANSLHRLA